MENCIKYNSKQIKGILLFLESMIRQSTYSKFLGNEIKEIRDQIESNSQFGLFPIGSLSPDQNISGVVVLETKDFLLIKFEENTNGENEK